MTAVQQNVMHTELWQSIGAIADNETLMQRLTRYAKKNWQMRKQTSPFSPKKIF